jgi:hypothetical protein
VRRILVVLVIAFWTFQLVNAQSGCTDPQATNYNVSATINDGSCIYPITALATTLKVNIPAVSENSGIEWVNGNLYTFGDSGNPPNIFEIDTVTGNIKQTIKVTNYENTDWEDMTADADYIYVGDFGNNDGLRKDLRVLKIAKSQFINDTNTNVSVTAEAINFSYADQTSFEKDKNTNFDCEAFLTLGDSLYLFTKDRGDFKTRIYRLPKVPGTYKVDSYTNYNVNGKITGADYNPTTKEVVLIGYMNGSKNSFVWYLNNFRGADFFSGNKHRLEIGNSTTTWQTEGIAFYNETKIGRICISNEAKVTPAGIYVADISIYRTPIKNEISTNKTKLK